MSTSDLVAINANDPQLAQVELLVRTLRDPARGAFDGRIVLVTTGVSATSAACLAEYGVEIAVADLRRFNGWSLADRIGAYDLVRDSAEWKSAARPKPAATASTQERWRWALAAGRLERQLTRRTQVMASDPARDRAQLAAAFDLYARKHFSKFGLLDHLQRLCAPSDRVVLLDSDIVFQRPAARLFARIESGSCLVEYEKESVEGDNPIARSNRLARRLPGCAALRFGPEVHEVNVGFLAAEAATLAEVMRDWLALILDPALAGLFTAHSVDAWHEQDFFRLLHDRQPERFRAAGKGLVYHAVHGAALELEERRGPEYLRCVDGLRPQMVHFAGGSWRRFISVAQHYVLRDRPSVTEPSRARTVLFGAGTDAQRELRAPRADERVVAVLDSNPKRRGAWFEDFNVFGPQELPLLEYDRIRIASSATSAIHRQLRALGIPEEKLAAPLYDTENRRRLAALKDVHRGRTAVIVGNGPSLRLADLDALAASDAVTFAFNKIYLAYDRTPFRPTYFMVEDHLVAENNAAAIDAVRGSTRLYRDFLLRWLQPADDAVLFGLSIEEPKDGRVGFSVDPLDLCWGASVTYSALQLALYMGCEKVYLTGIDFTFTMPGVQPKDVLVAGAERNHFLPEYRQPGERWNRPRPEVTQLAFEAARNHAAAHGCRIFNATRGGALKVFPRADFDAVFPRRPLSMPSGEVAP